MNETFFELLKSPGHWLFELFLMALFDGLVGALLWPFLRKHWREHKDAHHPKEAAPNSEICPYCQGNCELVKCPSCKQEMCSYCRDEHDLGNYFICEPPVREPPED